MFDGSAKEYGENIAQTCEIVKIAHALGGTVEGEIGHVGTLRRMRIRRDILLVRKRFNI